MSQQSVVAIKSLLKRRKEILIPRTSAAQRTKTAARLIDPTMPSLKRAACDYQSLANPLLNAKTLLTPSQTTMMLCLFGLLAIGMIFWPPVAGTGITLCYLAFCWASLGLKTLALYQVLRMPHPSHTASARLTHPENLPIFTILVPLYQEGASISHLVNSLRELSYPREKLDIKFLLEEDDMQTRIQAELHCKDDFFTIILIPPGGPRTKPKALNYGLWLAVGDYTVIYDAEDRPAPDQLLKAAAAFEKESPKTACIQARLNYYNRDHNWLTRLFTLEYSLLFDILLPGMLKMGLPVPLGGTSNFFKTKLLLRIGGWDPYNVTEDADIGLRLHRAGYNIAMLSSTTFEEAPAGLKDWLLQRSRWIKGYMQTWLVHARQTGSLFLGRDLKLIITLHLFIGGVIIAALVNPFFWLLYIFWITGITAQIGLTFPPFLMELSTITLLAGNLTLIYLSVIAPARRRWFRYSSYALLLPAYWALQSLAGFIALYQLFVKPYYWEKTTHHPEEDTNSFQEGTGAAHPSMAPPLNSVQR